MVLKIGSSGVLVLVAPAPSKAVMKTVEKHGLSEVGFMRMPSDVLMFCKYC